MLCRLLWGNVRAGGQTLIHRVDASRTLREPAGQTVPPLHATARRRGGVSPVSVRGAGTHWRRGWNCRSGVHQPGFAIISQPCCLSVPVLSTLILFPTSKGISRNMIPRGLAISPSTTTARSVPHAATTSPATTASSCARSADITSAVPITTERSRSARPRGSIMGTQIALTFETHARRDR